MRKSRLDIALTKIGNVAKIVWEVPAVKSVALTWLIRAGMSATTAGVVTAVIDAVTR